MGTTISVDETTLERFNEKKAETKREHMPEMAANDFVQMLLDTLEKVQEHGYGDGESDPEDIPEEIRDQLQRIESAAIEATNAAQSAEHAVDELAGGR